jgi:hypothetical protein
MKEGTFNELLNDPKQLGAYPMNIHSEGSNSVNISSYYVNIDEMSGDSINICSLSLHEEL